jgi:hypothetical protein
MYTGFCQEKPRGRKPLGKPVMSMGEECIQDFARRNPEEGNH